MKFCDKLAKQRKNNNFSQEQFADKMNVSRQAVSKWESGSSIPDMEKIIQMCKILNCNLDDLLDDGVIDSKQKSSQNSFNNYFSDFLSFITRVYNMFWSMTFKEKIKCIFEMFVIFIVLFILGSIVKELLFMIILNSFRNIDIIRTFVNNVVSPLVDILLLILGIIIFIHLFKIRYLDYFITVEDNDALEKSSEKALEEEKIINNKKYVVEQKKEKIIIRDPKHSTLHFINALGKILLLIVKFFIILFVIPVLFSTVVLIGLEAIMLVFIKYGILFFFISVAGMGVLLICYLIVYFSYQFLFNRKINFNKSFVIFVASLVLIGIGSGLSFISCMDYKKVDSLPKLTDVKTTDIEMEDNLVINEEYDTKYTIDNNVSNIKIKVTLPKDSYYSVYSNNSDDYTIYHIVYSGIDFIDAYKNIIEDLKHHQISNYYDSMKVEVITSEENYDILKANYDKYYK